MSSQVLPTRRRLAKLKRRGVVWGLALCSLASAWATWPVAASAQVGTPKYPNVRALPPFSVRLGRETVDFERHYVVRFSTLMYNAGPGPLELHGEPSGALDLSFNASQWIYGDPAGVRIEPVGSLVFHEIHRHYHFDGYGRYELWTKREWDRAQATGFADGKPRNVAAKVSFCIFDSFDVDRSPTSEQFYRTCTPAVQGVSAGWADLYDWGLPGQWVDVGKTPLPDGDYVLRNIADPFNVIFESDGKADPAKEGQVANQGVTPIKIVNGQLATS